MSVDPPPPTLRQVIADLQALAIAAAAHPDLDLRELAAELVSQADLLGRMVDELDAAAAVARADAPLVVRDPQTGRGWPPRRLTPADLLRLAHAAVLDPTQATTTYRDRRTAPSLDDDVIPLESPPAEQSARVVIPLESPPVEQGVPGQCRRCDAPIRWYPNRDGRRIPLDPVPIPASQVEPGRRWVIDPRGIARVYGTHPPSELVQTHHRDTCPLSGLWM